MITDGADIQPQEVPNPMTHEELHATLLLLGFVPVVDSKPGMIRNQAPMPWNVKVLYTSEGPHAYEVSLDAEIPDQINWDSVVETDQPGEVLAVIENHLEKKLASCASLPLSSSSS